MHYNALHSFVNRLAVFTGLALISVTSVALEYGGGIKDTEWKISGSIFECRFEQVLPKYGRGVFYHQSGEDIVFQLETRKNLMKVGKASISITPAPWHPSKKSEHLGFADLVNGRPNLQLDSERSNQFLHALLEGKQPVVTQRTFYDDTKSVKIHLSAIHFKDFYSNYLKCVDQLLPMNFSQVARNKIYFGGGKEGLSPKDEVLLDRIIFYMNNDPRVFAIYIDGHSDNRGRRYDNRQLSKNRAESVERYLIERGINTDIVTLRFHGQRYPIASNNTSAGRAKNRRVTVRLEQREEMEIPPDLMFVLPN
ncbi:MAG: outer membrane protein OmpA-like peptidoglycan-associated protein [Oleispira sp.]|jgi:outer membrane protein OmpA-like peptidoglycan-associated protein